MGHIGGKLPEPGIGAQVIDELIRNLEAGRLELGYSILLPSLFSVYLHADDYTAIEPVANTIRAGACRALDARVAAWNRSPALPRAGAKPKRHIAQGDWWIGFFAATEGEVPAGDVEIHSELTQEPQPGYPGARTTLMGREPAVDPERVLRDRERVRRLAEGVFAQIRYQDESGPRTYQITSPEITIGRGGEQFAVDLPLDACDEVSRAHLRLRRDPATGTFTVTDLSRNGTWVNGRRLARGQEEPLPRRAEIVLAEAVRLFFEAAK
jgi:hypothetical protein